MAADSSFYSALDIDPAKHPKSDGMRIVPPHPRLLTLDLDKGSQVNEDVLKRMGDLLRTWDRNVTPGPTHIAHLLASTTSKNGNRHEYYALPFPMAAPVRVALQAALGSDPVREMMAALRNELQPARPISVLYETPEEFDRIMPDLEREFGTWWHDYTTKSEYTAPAEGS